MNRYDTPWYTVCPNYPKIATNVLMGMMMHDGIPSDCLGVPYLQTRPHYTKGSSWLVSPCKSHKLGLPSGDSVQAQIALTSKASAPATHHTSRCWSLRQATQVESSEGRMIWGMPEKYGFTHQVWWFLCKFHREQDYIYDSPAESSGQSGLPYLLSTSIMIILGIISVWLFAIQQNQHILGNSKQHLAINFTWH